jgi:alpha-galactosidase
MTERFIRDWGFDGQKLDNIYTMPACHNPAHHHKSPEESIEAFAKVYQIILDTTLKLKPDSVTQICPCGTPILHSLMPAVNQTVTADPTSSLQIRQRIKFYKGLMGRRAAVFADHVELSDNMNDFASEVGTGGVPATKFVYPADESLRPKVKKYCYLPPNKHTRWKKWFTLYDQHRISEGEYLNLYDLAFDTPEAHAIRKENGIYYSFYAKRFQGEIEFRGLDHRNYRVVNIVNGRDLGIISPNNQHISVNFRGSLLVLATPIE